MDEGADNGAHGACDSEDYGEEVEAQRECYVELYRLHHSFCKG